MGPWTKTEYGKTFNPETEKWESQGGHWTISDGKMRFDISIKINGSGSMGSTPLREPGQQHWIVTPDEADEYAEHILQLLNRSIVHAD